MRFLSDSALVNRLLVIVFWCACFVATLYSSWAVSFGWIASVGFVVVGFFNERARENTLSHHHEELSRVRLATRVGDFLIAIVGLKRIPLHADLAALAFAVSIGLVARAFVPSDLEAQTESIYRVQGTQALFTPVWVAFLSLWAFYMLVYCKIGSVAFRLWRS
jgi:hypothetical protein